MQVTSLITQYMITLILERKNLFMTHKTNMKMLWLGIRSYIMNVKTKSS